MRSPLRWPLFWLVVLAAAGCDEKSASGPAEGGTLKADAPPPYEEPVRSPVPSAPRHAVPPPLAAGKGSGGSRSGAGPAGGEPGRVLFDGDTRTGSTGSSAVAARGGSGRKSVVYTAGARKDTLSVHEPPPPGASRPGAKGPGGSSKPGGLGDGGRGAGGGDVVLASAPGSSGGGDCPGGMVRIGSFCIDRYEGALVEVKDGRQTPWSPYRTPAPGRSYKAVSRAGQIPQGYISGAQAQAACRASGKRLCRLAEWEKACRGSAGATYPYGSTWEPRRCNEHDKEPGYASTILRVFPGFKFDDHRKFNDPRINQQPEGLAASGSFARCVSSYGVYDMVGNLHEWIADPAGTFKGGYYVDTYRNGPGCSYRTTAHPFTYHDYSTGFRCCADPS